MVKLVKVRWDLRPPNIKDRLPPSAVTSRVVKKCERFDYSVNKVAKKKKKGGRKKKRVAGPKASEVKSLEEDESVDRTERLDPTASAEAGGVVDSERTSVDSLQEEKQMDRKIGNKAELRESVIDKEPVSGKKDWENDDSFRGRRKQSSDKKESGREQSLDVKCAVFDKVKQRETSSEICLKDIAVEHEERNQSIKDRREKIQTGAKSGAGEQRLENLNAETNRRKHSLDVADAFDEDQEPKEQERNKSGRNGREQSLDKKESEEHTRKQSPDTKDSDHKDDISRSSRARLVKGPTRTNLCKKFSKDPEEATGAVSTSPLSVNQNIGPAVITPVIDSSPEEIDSELVDLASQLDYSGGFGDNDESEDEDIVSTPLTTVTSPRWRPPMIDEDKPPSIVDTSGKDSPPPSSKRCRGRDASRRVQMVRLKFRGDEEGEWDGMMLDLGEYRARQLLLRAQRVREAAARHVDTEKIEAKSPIICDLLRNDLSQMQG